MAKKLKEYYNMEYCLSLGEKIISAYPPFDTDKFISLVSQRLDFLEFNDRQILIATSLKECLPESYEQTLNVFTWILGPEIEGSLGMFSEGWWLWPIGKFVELYGDTHFELSTAFSKELTKRFTGEYCMRPILIRFPEKTMRLMLEWSKDEHQRVRRLASECLRIYLPWSKKTDVVLQHFDLYQKILSNLRNDPDKTIQKSVANNLNDLYKADPQKFEQIISEWESSDMTKACEWIIRHASRTKNKSATSSLRKER
ncbi:MAG: DNA alkylation repair protein [Porphyromonas sp.]|nr:DNA alkylation repair protein [Porphyromonas sp.]